MSKGRTLLTSLLWGAGVFSLLLSGAAGEPVSEPDKLVSLRDSWRRAKERDARPIKVNYLNALTKLRDRLTQQQAFGNAVLVQEEIKALTEGADREQEGGDDSGRPAVLATLCEKYDRDMARMREGNDRKYGEALKALRKRYAQAGELEAAMAVQAELGKLEEQTEPPDVSSSPWATIEVESSLGSVSVQLLTKGAERLSGGYRPPFTKVSKDLVGAHFLRVPWQSKSTMTVRVKISGDLLSISPSKESLESDAVDWRQTKTLVGGPYLTRVFRARVRQGDQFKVSGFELSLIAQEIALEK